VVCVLLLGVVHRLTGGMSNAECRVPNEE
jgi:hypothetical protein